METFFLENLTGNMVGESGKEAGALAGRMTLGRRRNWLARWRRKRTLFRHEFNFLIGYEGLFPRYLEFQNPQCCASPTTNILLPNE